ncbi:hypothetical protein [Mesorhizobium sp. KR2-14]|uniref:hypothetical protein n=1 Tax=Mesorhizobium sp. KR2-14 TaxID=3156610 RepID=UPI0032B39BB2
MFVQLLKALRDEAALSAVMLYGDTLLAVDMAELRSAQASSVTNAELGHEEDRDGLARDNAARSA